MPVRSVAPTFAGTSVLEAAFLQIPAVGYSTGVPRPTVEWRFVLCDLNGFPISVISQVMLNTTMTFLLNRPSSLTFQVPSDDIHFNTIYTSDGWNDPFLACGDRVIKGYRKTSLDTDWTLRYVGRVWSIQDTGDGNSVNTTVTCYDSLQELSARIVRDHSGGFHKTVYFKNQKYGTAIKHMIDRANNFGARPTTIRTDGYWDPSINVTDLAYNQAKILASIITICDTAQMDLAVTYLDANRTGTTPSFPGKHMKLGAWKQVGSLNNSVAIFGYAAPPRNTASFTRTQDMATFANDVTMYGASNKGKLSHSVDSGSGLDKYGAFEDVIVESSIHTQKLLDDLTTEILALRKKPREIINFVPLPELAPLPWDDWNLGDTITVYIGGNSANPLTREARIGKQRVYGYTIGIEENYSEHVTAMILSADAEPSS